MESPNINFAGIEKAVRSVVGSRLEAGDTLNADTPLISSGLIDSLDLATLIAALEKEFAIRISYELFQDTARFETICSISQLIQEARKQAGEKAEKQESGRKDTSALPGFPPKEGGFLAMLGKIFPRKQ